MAEHSIVLSAVNAYEYWYTVFRYRAKVPSGTTVPVTNKDSSGKYFCLRLPDASETLGTKALLRVEPKIRLQTVDVKGSSILAFALKNALPNIPAGSSGVSAPDPVELSFPPRTPGIGSAIPAPGQDFTLTSALEATADLLSADAYNVLKNQAVVFTTAGRSSTTGTFAAYQTLLNGDAPTVTVYYDDAVDVKSKVVISGSQTSGYLNPRKDKKFGWFLTRDTTETYFCIGGFTCASATFYWKESSDENWNSISATGNNQSVTVPANTFPEESSIDWYVSVTDQNGCTSTSATYTLSTTDGTSTATPVSPVNLTINGSEDNVFVWSVSNPSGEAHTRSEAMWGESKTGPWHALFDISSDATECTVPAGTFTVGGTLVWSVRSYNADGVAGPYSDSVVITVVSPPSAPDGVTATQVPFSTLTWQASGQLAYEVFVDGVSVKKGFGAGIYNYKLEEPLSDGEHVLGVRVQGNYGLWSEQGETTVVIENQSSADLTLQGRFDVDAELSWIRSPDGGDGIFRVYRDGKRIGRSDHYVFRDRLAIGAHEYYVLEELSDGNYNRSQDLTGIMKSCITRIAAAAGGEWLDLDLSENSDDRQSFTWQRNVSLRHVAGAVYPVAEVSSFQEKTGTYDCAFRTVAEAKAFEELCGIPVIIKSRGGEILIGLLSQIQKQTSDFYIAYQFSVQQIHWEDFFDDTVS